MKEPLDKWCPDDVMAACRTTGPAPGSQHSSPSSAASPSALSSSSSSAAATSQASPPWRVLLFEQTASTNDIALREAVHGHPAGLVVAAAAQTKGRGRQGRSWVSPRGAGLYVSVLLRPDYAAADASRLTAIAAVAAAEAIESVAGNSLRNDFAVTIKWPNDLHIRSRKVGGVLIEAGIQAGRMTHAVVGIGINVSHAPEDFPPELRTAATSILQEMDASPQPTPRTLLLARLMDSLAAALALPFEEIRNRWTQRCHTLGRTVTLRQPDGATLHGVAIGLGSDGVLHLKDETGRLHSVHAGEVLSQ